MRLGTIIQLSDGRIGTVVYNGLEGYGIKWGRHYPQDHPEDFEGTTGGMLRPPEDAPCRRADWPWRPDALLRDPPAGKPNFWREQGWDAVGSDYTCVQDVEDV